MAMEECHPKVLKEKPPRAKFCALLEASVLLSSTHLDVTGTPLALEFYQGALTV
jgi:hypothetical protein